MKNQLSIYRTAEIRKWLLFGLMIGAFFMATGQNRRGDRLTAKLEYVRALDAYQRAWDKQENTQSMVGIANCYWELSRWKETEAWYYRVAYSGRAKPEHMYRYALALKANGKYEEAAHWFLKYGKAIGNDSLGAEYAATCEYAEETSTDTLGYTIISLPFNTEASEIGPAIYKRGIVFSSNRQTGFFAKLVTARSEEPFYDLYFSDRDVNGSFLKTVRLEGKINSRFHDGPVTFSPAQHIAYLTRSDLVKGKVGRDSKGINKLRLFKTIMIANEWQTAVDLPFCSSEYSTAHPSLTSDEKVLYFSSDMPGGFGGKDIYRVVLSDTAKWSRPENLGEAINTSGDEVFPYIHEDGTLFFASTGHPGLGGLDIFAAEPTAEGEFGEIFNLGATLNSSADDFGVIWEPKKPNGFFVSNRAGGKGGDDIYAFSRIKKIKGKVIDKITGTPLQDVEVLVLDIYGKTDTLQTDKNGTFRYYIQKGTQFFVSVHHPDYEPHTMRLTTQNILANQNVPAMVELRPLYVADEEPISEEDSLKKADQLEQLIEEKGISLDTLGKNWVRGIVVSKESGMVLTSAIMIAYKVGSDSLLAKTVTDNDGYFEINIGNAKSCEIVASKGAYLSGRATWTAGDNAINNPIKIELIELEEDKIVRVIYYDYNSTVIDSAGKVDLDEIVSFLKDNPQVKVELSAHTDAIGSDRFNQRLSQGRADEAVKYILTKEITRDRIIAKGFGESKLVVNCLTKLDCSDELHRQNRRTEVKVIEIQE